MTKNRTPTPVYLDPGMHSGLEVKGLTTFKPYKPPNGDVSQFMCNVSPLLKAATSNFKNVCLLPTG